jgi:hypothetical protein
MGRLTPGLSRFEDGGPLKSLWQMSVRGELRTLHIAAHKFASEHAVHYPVTAMDGIVTGHLRTQRKTQGVEFNRG